MLQAQRLTSMLEAWEARRMKIFIATAASQPWSIELADRFRHLARISRFDAHGLADTAEEADAILFVDLHQFPDDWSLSTLRRHPLVSKHARKVFVYDERDRPWCEWPGIFVSMPRAGFERSRQRAYSYYEIKTEMAPAPASRADLLFSFQGARSHSSREAILQLSHPRGHVEDTSQLNFFDFSEQADTPEYKSRVAAQKARYQEIVARSKFVLCPRGMGNSSFRLMRRWPQRACRSSSPTTGWPRAAQTGAPARCVSPSRRSRRFRACSKKEKPASRPCRPTPARSSRSTSHPM
jgi:hypothetical protein